MSKNKLWGGRFSGRTHQAVERFTHSLSVDRRLARFDLLGSLAHARMLGKQKILSRSDSARLVRGLTGLLKDLERGALKIDPSAEDIHSAIQSALEKKAGPAAQRLHTARSRNDQVVTSFRLYCADAATRVSGGLHELEQVILGQVKSAGDQIMPGYTHVRHAQPVLVSHLLLSYMEMLERDRIRMERAGEEALREMPLGSGALTGTGLPIDRAFTARQLGFKSPKANSIDGVTDRDFAAEFLSALAILSIHLSRIAEELILWSTQEFNFLRFDQRMLTGSSMMPQKQNPDFLELVRAGTSRTVGNLSGFLVLLKGLPSGYQRDLQLDKELLFESLDRAEAMLEVMAAGLKGIRWNRAALDRALQDESLYATDLAEVLVEKGVPFALAHRAVGQLLADSDRRKKPLRHYSSAELKQFSPFFGDGTRKLLQPAASVRRKRSLGSTNPARVRREIARWSRSLRGGTK